MFLVLFQCISRAADVKDHNCFISVIIRLVGGGISELGKDYMFQEVANYFKYLVSYMRII